jgi:hypothetical protein
MNKDKINKLKIALVSALGAGIVVVLLQFAEAIKTIFG